MNVITTTRTYATPQRAERALTDALWELGLTHDRVRWLIAVAKDGRFAPTVVLTDAVAPFMLPLVQRGVMVIN